jgi:putative tryptophan/tyrosine transport system substrate-binding protein
MNLQRRQFIALLGGAAAAWPIAARAQQADQVRRVGLLLGIANGPVGQAYARAFEQQLQHDGWTVGRNLAIEVRWGEGQVEHFAEIVSEFVRLKVDVIVTTGTPSALLAKQATSVIPIVFTGAGDPIGTGLITSLARPGGNLTGLSNQNRDAAGKRVEFLREMDPGLRRLAILSNVDNTSVVLITAEVEQAARKLGLDVIKLEIRREEDIAPALSSLGGSGLALYVVGDTLTRINARRISTLALAARLPTMHENRDQVEAGGLMSYAVNFSEQYQRAADYVDKILRGAKPADLPVEQPNKLDLVINVTTAKALGLTVPPTLLVAADEVLE